MFNFFYKKLFLTILAMLAVTGCSTTGYDATSNYNDANVIGNKNSDTIPDRTLNQHYSLQILTSGVSEDNYVRVSLVSLNDMVVIAAISETNVKNKTFVNILKNSGTKPILNSVFHLSPVFTRKGNFKITNITVADIKNHAIHAYLVSQGYKNNKHLIERTSIFTYRNETMKLIEYILPSVEDYTKFYLMNAN